MSQLLTTGLAISGYLAVEIARYRKHRFNLRKIPVRIHVNGTRGKSSVTRLIYGGLRADKSKTIVAKTTGTEARFLFPDGRELPVARPGKPNIIEQLRIVARAADLRPDIFVTECMAITPEYIRILEEKIIQSTIGVITNVREDHLDTMGPTQVDLAHNLCFSLPRNGLAFTTERKYLAILRAEAEKKNCQLVSVDTDQVSDDDMNRFSYIEHKENVAVALAVCDSFGIKRAAAFDSMVRTNSDPGVLERCQIHAFGKKISFYNAFAANDPESTIKIWNLIRDPAETRILLFCVRADRASRTESFIRFLGSELQADFYIICGEPGQIVRSALIRAGVAYPRVFTMGNTTAEEIFNKILLITRHESVCLGIGNIVGLGRTVMEFFKSRSVNP
jgi:poly-gamma-glutamate synthase PgsB/CapB